MCEVCVVALSSPTPRIAGLLLLASPTLYNCDIPLKSIASATHQACTSNKCYPTFIHTTEIFSPFPSSLPPSSARTHTRSSTHTRARSFPQCQQILPSVASKPTCVSSPSTHPPCTQPHHLKTTCSSGISLSEVHPRQPLMAGCTTERYYYHQNTHSNHPQSSS